MRNKINSVVIGTIMRVIKDESRDEYSYGELTGFNSGYLIIKEDYKYSFYCREKNCWEVNKIELYLYF